MKKIIALLLLWFTIFMSGDTTLYQKISYPVYTDEAYHFIESSEFYIIDGDYNMVNFFSEGLGIAQKNNKYGAINALGETVIPFDYKYLSDFHDGLAFASIDGIRASYINKNNEIVISDRFNLHDIYGNISDSDFSEGKAIVYEMSENNDIHGAQRIVIDTEGKELSSVRTGYYIHIGKFHCGLLRCEVEFYSSEGDMVIDPMGRSGTIAMQMMYAHDIYIPTQFSYEMSAVPKLKDESLSFNNVIALGNSAWYYEYVNTSGEKAFVKNFDKAESFSESLAVVELDGKMGVIDIDGNFVFYNDSLIFNEYYHSGLIAFQDLSSGDYGFLNTVGEVAITPAFDDVYMGFVDDLALVKTGDNLAYVNKSGEIVITFDYSDDLVRKAEELNYEAIFQD
jgi:hypothetical protein